MMNRKFILIFFFSFLPVTCLLAQKIDAALEKMVKQYPDEKVHLHLDKDYYIAGETIWFKAYLYSQNLPSMMSTNFFLQVLDKDGRLIKENRYPVTGATVSGNIILEDSLPKGNYWLRAFTPWMLNFGEEFIYHRPVFVINAATSRAPLSNNNKDISLRFFPESGNLVDGILTSVAFQAVNSIGIPVHVEGNIVQDDGSVISPFKTFYNGMGKVQFKPIAGKKYNGEILVNGKPVRFPLPDVMSSGVSLKVIDEKGGKMFQIARSEKDKTEFNELHLIVVQNKLIVFETDVSIDDYPSVRGHLLTDNLPTGIINFTLFSKSGAPVAERLSFVNNGEYKSNVDLQAGVMHPGKREKNSFEILLPDTLQRSLSVSVTDASFTLPNQETIFSRFLLTSDLKGPIYNPAWYFSGTSDTIKQTTDLLMMTNGWTRYRWEKILNNEFSPLSVQDPGMMKISGVARDARDKEIVQGGYLTFYIESPDLTHTSYDVNVDTKGVFLLDSMALFGKTKVFYVYFNAKGKPQSVTITLDEEKKLDTGKDPASISLVLKNDPRIEANQAASVIGDRTMGQFKVLEEVQLAPTSKKDSLTTNQKYATGPFTKEARTMYDFVASPPKNSSQSIVDFVRQNIPQVQYSNGGFVSKKNFSLQGGTAWPVSVFLDNSVTSPVTMQGLMVSDVALVKFYETGFFGTGTSASGGTIAIFTKKGDDLGDKNSMANLPFFVLNGFTVTKEFYRPDYSQSNLLANPAMDKASTLYWNPTLLPAGKEGKINIEFYNNDISKKYRIVVEGFDATGKLIHLEKIMGQ
jgi:hypothetical protein